MKIIQKFNPINIILLFFALIYIFLPTNNSTGDAYLYAYTIKYGRELFFPHHLLYNAFGYLLFNLCQTFSCFSDTLGFMKIVNAIAAVLCLIIFKYILMELNKSKSEIFALLIFCGSSFGFMRFATENENYILPIVFSLWASYYLLKFSSNNKRYRIVFSGLLAALACLFHQIHFFWWLGLLGIVVSFRNLKLFLLFTIPAFVVPIAYMLVIKFYNKNDLGISSIIKFIFHDYYTGDAKTDISGLNFLLTPVSFIRTFFQVHGLMATLLKKNIYYYFVIALSIFFLIIAFLQKKIVRKKNVIQYANYLYGHFAIFSLQLLFAFYSVGNAEFMVMLPVLLVLSMTLYFTLNTRTVFFLGLSMLLWNLNFGLFANHFYKLNCSAEITKTIFSHPDDLFILVNKSEIYNEYLYRYGIDPKNIESCPSKYISDIKFIGKLKIELTNTLTTGNKVCTDCVGNKKVLTRATIVYSHSDSAFFKNYKLDTLFNFQYLHGRYQLFIVR